MISDYAPRLPAYTWATWHYQANRDLTALRSLGGWKTHEMVMRYTHSNVEEHAHTIDRLPGEISLVSGRGCQCLHDFDIGQQILRQIMPLFQILRAIVRDPHLSLRVFSN